MASYQLSGFQGRRTHKERSWNIQDISNDFKEIDIFARMSFYLLFYRFSSIFIDSYRLFPLVRNQELSWHFIGCRTPPSIPRTSQTRNLELRLSREHRPYPRITDWWKKEQIIDYLVCGSAYLTEIVYFQYICCDNRSRWIFQWP